MVSTEPVDYAEVGVRIDKVTMMIKPLEIYYTIDYTVTNREKFAALDGGLDFEIIDPNSGAAEYWEQRLKDGPSAQAQADRPTAAIGTRRSHGSRGNACAERMGAELYPASVQRMGKDAV